MKPLLRNLLLVIPLCGLSALVVLARLDYALTGIDDANIYFVYARNLANGYGFVYNVGGERVAGFTSLLWTLVSAVVFKISNQPELILLLINIVLLSLGIAAAVTYLQSGFPREEARPNQSFYPVLFLTLVLTSPRYIVWNTVTLMENGLWSTLLLVTTIFVTKNFSSTRLINAGFVLLSVLLVLTRPESVVWGGLFLGILFLRRASLTSATQAGRELSPAILGLAASISLMILFQLEYFGYPFPNTYYAKVSPSFAYNVQQGAIYLAKYTISDPIVFLSVAATIISVIHTYKTILAKRSAVDGPGFLPIIAATGLVSPLLTGGDHFGSFRLYQNIYPIEILSLLYFIDRILMPFLRSAQRSEESKEKQKVFQRAAALIFTGALVISQAQMWQSVRSEVEVEFRVADYGRKNGAFIQTLFSPLHELPSLGVVVSGGIKYSYVGPVVDLMGLNNTLVAHNHGDRRGIKNHAAFSIATFYQLQPDVVWPRTVRESDWQYHQSEIQLSWENRQGLKGLFDQPRFLELYRFAKLSSRTSNGYALVGWVRNELIEELRTRPGFNVQVYAYEP